jgi:OOP family OmpA-OmpF porin
MKTIFTIIFLFISGIFIHAQENKNTIKSKNEINNWTIEAFVGQGKGVNPYSTGYYSSNPDSFFGSIQANDFSLGFRYMINQKFGVKTSFSYQNFKNIKNNGSLPFEMKLMGISFQGVANLRKVFELEESFKRLGLFVHGGIKIDQMQSKTENNAASLVDHNYGVKEYNGGLIFGITPQIKITDKLSFNLDVTIQSNYRQHFNWDGSYGTTSNNLKGQIVTSSIGLSYSLGKHQNGDWSNTKFGNNELLEMNKRLSEIETLMNDTDKDGVPDYLDAENNSITGVAVDTKGRMIDMNTNGVPDELEKHLTNNYFSKTETKETTNTDNIIIAKLINEGYITAYFDFNKTQPTNESSEGIDFILTFLRNYKNSSIDIIGHADEVGNSEKNQKLANSRALNVKNTLIKAGISSDRMNIISDGEDTSVDITSENARRLVRRVTFKVK